MAEPLLDMEAIQGNILGGFSKDFQTLIALKVREIEAATRWLNRILPEINNSAEVFQFNTLFRLRRKRLAGEPKGLVATWANIAFSHSGLSKFLTVAELAEFSDPAFQTGLTSARSAALGDPQCADSNDPTAKWVIGGTNHPFDILLILASDDPKHLDDAEHRVLPLASDGDLAPIRVWRERGATRSDLPGHEHFGFKDGISQPGIRGLVSDNPAQFFTPRLLSDSQPGDIQFSKPGQPLVYPGQFVLGYPETDRTSGNENSAASDVPSLARNGSYLVFRRLRQDVFGFHNFLRTESQTVSANPTFSPMTPERLGALIVGRWASGAPISRTPEHDDVALANDSFANNDFVFTEDTPAPSWCPGQGPSAPAQFPAAKEDTLGFICPHAAHIRKVNPRDQDSDQGDQFDTLTRRILRRSIPYGRGLASDASDDGRDRGLHFLSYQASIVNQFELLQRDWANSTQNPKPGGTDLVIGQSSQSVADQAGRSLSLLNPDGSSQVVTTFSTFVMATGGEYLFAPSLHLLKTMATSADTNS